MNLNVNTYVKPANGDGFDGFNGRYQNRHHHIYIYMYICSERLRIHQKVLKNGTDNPKAMQKQNKVNNQTSQPNQPNSNLARPGAFQFPYLGLSKGFLYNFVNPGTASRQAGFPQSEC